MLGKQLLPLLLASLFAAATAHAAIDLIAIGSVSGSYEDFAVETAGPLENGVPGNRLGGIGSGLAYAGCNTFIGALASEQARSQRSQANLFALSPRDQVDMQEVDKARTRQCSILLAKTTARHQPETVIAWDYETRQVGR